MSFRSLTSQALVRQLRDLLPADSVLWRTEDLRPYECDGLSIYRKVPLAVVLPWDEPQVVGVMKLCHDAGVPVIARGAGTGLSGGATPRADAVVLSLARLNQILHMDPLARTARVQPGVRNLAISEAAAQYQLYYAPDPSSQIACTIGGNVAENSGGVHCLKYGLTVHNVLSARIVTGTGEVLTVGSAALDSPGYDVLALLIGSEGLLGVVTEVTVRLLPRPECARVILAGFDSTAKAGNAVAAIIAAGIIPAGLELMDRAAIAAVEPFVQAGYPLDAEALLLCESDGTVDEVDEEILVLACVAQHLQRFPFRVTVLAITGEDIVIGDHPFEEGRFHISIAAVMRHFQNIDLHLPARPQQSDLFQAKENLVTASVAREEHLLSTGFREDDNAG